MYDKIQFIQKDNIILEISDFDLFQSLYLFSERVYYNYEKTKYGLIDADNREINDGDEKSFILEFSDFWSMFGDSKNPFPLHLINENAPLKFRLIFKNKYLCENSNVTYNFTYCKMHAYHTINDQVSLYTLQNRFTNRHNWFILSHSNCIPDIIDTTNLNQKYPLQHYINNKRISLMSFIIRSKSDLANGNYTNFTEIDSFTLKGDTVGHLDHKENEQVITIDEFNNLYLVDMA